MGVISEDVLEGTLLCVQLTAGIFCGIVLFKVFQAVVLVEKAQRQMPTEAFDEETLCPSRCCFYTASQLMLRFTLSTISFFMLHYVSGVLYRVVYFTFSQNGPNECVYRLIIWIFYCGGAVFGYPLMFVTHFERLRLTFSGSSEELPKWAPKLMYAILLLFLSALIGVMAFRWSEPIASAACMALMIFINCASVGALIALFFKKTMAIGRGFAEVTDLLETAARISIVVTVSLLSTTLASFFWILTLTVCPVCHFWILVANIATSFDLCLNAFCLFCTFASANKPYKLVFGTLHAAFIRYAATPLDDLSPIEMGL